MLAKRTSLAEGWWLRALTEVFVIALVLAILPYTAEAGDIKPLLIVWAAALLSAGCLFRVIWNRTPLRPPTLLGGILGAYLAYTLGAALLSSHHDTTLPHWITVATYVALYLAVAQSFRDVSQVRRLVAVICAAMTLAALYGFCQRAGYDPFPWTGRDTEEYQHLPSTFGNPNYAGHALVIALTLFAGLVWTKGYRRYALLGLPIAAHFALTGMRGGRVALLAGAAMVAVAWLWQRRTKHAGRAVALTFATVALCGIVGLAGLLGVHKATSGRYFPLDPSLLLRYNSYYGATRMILAHPLKGVGPGAYAIENPPYWTPYEQSWYATEKKVNEHVHNDLLEEAVDGGLPAAGLYLAFLLSAIAQSLTLAMSANEAQRRHTGYALAAMFTAFLVDGLFGFNLRVPVSGALLFVMAGALEGLRRDSVRNAPSPRVTGVYVAATGLALVAALLGTGVFLAQCHLRRGAIAMDRKQFPQALDQFIAAHDYAPWRLEPLFDMARCAHAVNRLDDAVAWFDQVIRKNPNHLPALDSLARTLADRAAGGESAVRKVSPEDDLRRASETAARALTLCPNLPETLECRGRVLSIQAVLMMRAGKPAADVAETWKEARAQLESAARLGAANRGRVQRMLAEACIGLGDLDGAQRAFARAIDLAPDDENLRAFALFATKSNRYTAYVDALQAAIARRTGQAAPDRAAMSLLYVSLADALEKIKVPGDAAVEALRNALRQTPDRYALWERYARTVQYRFDAIAAARNDAAKAGIAKVAPAIDAVFVTASDAEQLAAAVRVTAQACLDNAQSMGPEGMRRNFRWIADALRTRIDALPPATPGLGNALRMLGPVYAALGDAEIAGEVLGKAEKVLTGPDRIQCMLEHANLLEQAGRVEDALTLARRARAEAPGNPVSLFCEARISAVAGQTDAARGLFEALKRNPAISSELRRQVEQQLSALR